MYSLAVLFGCTQIFSRVRPIPCTSSSVQVVLACTSTAGLFIVLCTPIDGGQAVHGACTSCSLLQDQDRFIEANQAP